MSILKILTYNVCWECISGTNKGSAKILGEKCGKTLKKNNKNLCFRNISNISSFTSFDLIGLQEGNIKLANNIIKKLGRNFKFVYSRSCKEHSIIIYNSSKLLKVGKSVNGFLEQCGRAYMYQKFIHKKSNKELIVGNFHGPRLKHNWLTKYILQSNKLANKESRIIIFGDFNKKLKKSYYIKKTRKIITPVNKKIKTGSNKDKLKTINEKIYSKNIDNILLSNNIKLIGKLETLSSVNNILLPKDVDYKLANYSSDHRPLAVKIKI